MDIVTFYRRLPKFDYVKPESIEEALNLLGDNEDGKYMVYAGGTNVIPNLKKRLTKTPKILIDLKGIAEMDYIEYDEKKGIRIGALATISSVVNAPIVKEKFAVLSQAADSIAATQIQNRGTIVGNICDASPFADTVPALLALEARLLCVSSKGERIVRIEEFFAGPDKTVLNANELLKEIQIPDLPEDCNGAYIRIAPRKRMDIAVAGVAAIIGVENGLFRDVRIGLSAVAPAPTRSKKVEDMLKGKRADNETILKAAKMVSEEADPIDDYRASAQYRRAMIEVLVKRAISQAVAN